MDLLDMLRIKVGRQQATKEKPEKGRTKDKRYNAKYDEAEHSSDVALAQDHAYHLCKRIAEGHETQGSDGEAHDKENKIPQGRVCKDGGRKRAGGLGRQC